MGDDERPRLRAALTPADVADDDPQNAQTPRESGSYAIWSGACRETGDALRAWRPNAPPAIHERIDKIIAGLDDCRVRVEQWPIAPPSPAERQALVAEIARHNTAALDLAKLMGVPLFRNRRR